jgi:hypothetical protein
VGSSERKERKVGLLDRAKSVAEQATTKAKEGLEEVQARRDLGQAYGELGRLTFELVGSGELTNERLNPVVERIRALEVELKDEAKP